MPIQIDEVRTTAAMARLALSEEELHQMAAELGRILAYMEQLQEVPVDGVEPQSHALDLPCPLRPDEVGPHLPVERALANASDRRGTLFCVPAVLPRDEG
jgi:aspartyl-tRNA(Asn)/glutamyl-tRNA(Gln) amidotransferase subunit C